MEKHPWFAVLLIFILAGCTGVQTPAASPTSSILIRTPYIQTASPTPIPTKTATPYNSKSPVAQKPLEEVSPVGNNPTEVSFPAQTLMPGQPWPERLYLFIDPGMIFFVDGTERGNSWGDPAHILFAPPRSGVTEVVFANFADRMAYIDFDQNLWVSNLHADSKKKVFRTNQSPVPFEIEMLWSPDDQHLLVDFPDDWAEQDMIYHVQENIVEPWPYQCDRLILSSKSNKVAVGCSANEGAQHKMAVMEWGGQIWYQDTLSEKEILVTPPTTVVGNSNLDLFSIFRIAGWTVGGERVAFFDVRDGSLKIMNSQWRMLKTVPKKAYFLSEAFQAHKILPAQPIQWTRSGNSILAYANGTTDDPCPEQTIEIDSNVKRFLSGSCWQIIDGLNGQTV